MHEAIVRLAESPPRIAEHEGRLFRRAAGQEQIDHAREFARGERGFASGGQSRRLVAARQPGELPSQRGREQAQAEFFQGFATESFQERQSTVDPALVPTQELGRFDLRQLILAHQGVNDPSFLQFRGTLADAIQVIDCRLGTLRVDIHPPRVKPLNSLERPGARSRLKPSITTESPS